MKPEVLNYIFEEMVESTEQLVSLRGTDGKYADLPSFLTALASMVREMQEVIMHVYMSFFL